VRRFVQLIGIYPAGTLVRLNTGEVAVVRTVYAPDPYRPAVRVLIGRDGKRLELPFELNLWKRRGARTPLVDCRAARSRALPIRSVDADVTFEIVRKPERV